jgi:hypothetical protein
MHITKKWAKKSDTYNELKDQIKNDDSFCLPLQTSLMIAKNKATKEIHSDLYFAIDDVFNGEGGPTSPDVYLKYIEQYLVLIPNEIDDPMYPNAWSSDDTQNGYNQKVYDLLCHFYFLVDQTLPITNTTLQDYKNGGDCVA